VRLEQAMNSPVASIGRNDQAGRPYIGHVQRVVTQSTPTTRTDRAMHDLWKTPNLRPALRCAGCPHIVAAVEASHVRRERIRSLLSTGSMNSIAGG